MNNCHALEIDPYGFIQQTVTIGIDVSIQDLKCGVLKTIDPNQKAPKEQYNVPVHRMLAHDSRTFKTNER